MVSIQIPLFSFPHLEPSEENEEIDTVVLNYDDTLVGAEYNVIAIDPNGSYEDAEQEGA